MKRYTVEQKAHAVEVAGRIGCAAACRQLQIPKQTLWQWVKVAGEGTARPKAVVDNVGAKQAKSTENESIAKHRVARLYTPSQRAQALELVAKTGPSEASRKLGISRFSLCEWRRKQRAYAEGHSTDSPLVGDDSDKAQARDSRILHEWKRHPGLGPSQIRNQLRRDGYKVSVRTARMVMEENGYVTPKVKRVEAHNQRYEAVRPNQLWHMDFMQQYIHKQRVSVMFIVDDFSRYIPGFALCDQDRSEAVFECFESSVARHGKPESVMSDGGAAFWAWRGISRFSRLLDEMEINQIIAKVPQVNGKLEVLNANAQKELFNQEKFFDLGETLIRLRAWVSFYNLRRTHHALGGLLVPADRYFGRADEVLARVESGRSPDGVGEPLSVADRQLDLLRVCSHAGKVEVMLMGERIWPQSPRP